MIGAIRPRMAPLWRTDSSLYDELISRGQDFRSNTRLRHTPLLQPSGRWQFLDAVPLTSAVPLVAGATAATPDIANIRQGLMQGSNPTTLSSLYRFNCMAATSIRSGQSVSDGLREMFMAKDKHRQAQIEASVKEAEGRQTNSHFHWRATLDDLLKMQESDDDRQLLWFRLLMRHQETCSRIIANM